MISSAFFIILILLFLISLPVAFSMGITAVMLMASTAHIRFGQIIQQMVGGVNTFTFLAVPMFLLAGKLMNASGTTDRIFGFARNTIGWIPGGLGHANVFASVLFAGKTGTAVGDVSALGAIQVKAMTEAGYDRPFSCAVSAASSTMGPIFPPSLPLIVYGTMSGASIGALFLAGVLPGVVMAIIMFIVVSIFAVIRKYPRDPLPSIKTVLVSFARAILPLLSPVIIILGIFTGAFTPTEAAAIVVFYSTFLGVVIYRTLNLRKLWEILTETVYDAAAIGLIVATATLFANVVVRAMIPQHALAFVTANITSPIVLLIVINIFLLIVGMFLETISAITILMPLMLPLVNAMGINLVHFGIVVVLNLVIGVLTPPMGIVTFVMARVGKMSVPALSYALLPWIAALIVALFIVTFVPEITLIIPRMAGFIN